MLGPSESPSGESQTSLETRVRTLEQQMETVLRTLRGIDYQSISHSSNSIEGRIGDLEGPWYKFYAVLQNCLHQYLE